MHDAERATSEQVNEPLNVIRSMSPWAYKSGEWAEVVGESVVDDRECWEVLFADGSVDTWVKDDPAAEYEYGVVVPDDKHD